MSRQNSVYLPSSSEPDRPSLLSPSGRITSHIYRAGSDRQDFLRILSLDPSLSIKSPFLLTTHIQILQDSAITIPATAKTKDAPNLVQHKKPGALVDKNVACENTTNICQRSYIREAQCSFIGPCKVIANPGGGTTRADGVNSNIGEAHREETRADATLSLLEHRLIDWSMHRRKRIWHRD